LRKRKREERGEAGRLRGEEAELDASFGVVIGVDCWD